MAFTNNVIAVARNTKLFVGLESTPGVQIPPSGCSTVLVAGAGSVQQMIRHIPDPQYRNTRSRLLPIVGSFEAGKFQFPCLIKTVAQTGSPATPEIDVFLHCLMGLPAGSDSTWFGSTPHRAYLLLPTTPGGTVYPSFTGWFQIDHTMFYFAGATVNQGEFDIAGNELSKVNFTGEFMRMGWAGTDAPASTGSGTSLPVTDASKYYIAQAGDVLTIGIWDGSTLNGPYTVTAINYGTKVLTLSGGASWTTSDIVVPMLPAPSEVGVPLYGKYGLVQLAPWSSNTFGALPSPTQVLNSLKVTITNGIKYYVDVKDGSQYPTEYAAPAFRDVKGQIGIFMYRNIPGFNLKALADPLVPDYIVIPTTDLNNDAGRLFEIHVPRAIYMTPAISGEDDKTCTIDFTGVADSNYDDELALVYYGG